MGKVQSLEWLGLSRLDFLTQQVQSGLCFVLSDRGQPTPVARERGHLSVQEGVLGADSLDNRKRTWLADEELPFRLLGDLLRTCPHRPAEQVSGWFR